MNKLDADAEIRALRAAALEDLDATSDVDLVLEALADGEQIDVIAARGRFIMLGAAATALRQHISASDHRCENLSARSFEQMVRALALRIFGPHVTDFADGPDGNREATFDGRVAYCDGASGWAGKGVLQVTFQPVSSHHLDYATWLTDLLDRAFGRYRREGNRLYRPNGTVELIEEPRYYVLITNVVLSSVAGMCGKDKVIARLEDYRQKLGWEAFDLWDGVKISCLSRDMDAIHHKVGYKTQFGREQEAVSAEAPSFGELRDVVRQRLANQGRTDVEWGAQPRSALDEAQEQRSASALRVMESTSSDVLICSYIQDEDLPEELLRRVRACAMAITHDSEAIKEIEQQVKLKLLAVNRERWEQITRKWGYVIRIAQNESRTWLRREARQRGSVIGRKPHELKASPPDGAVPDWGIEELRRLLGLLGRECAEVVIRVWLLGSAVRTVGVKMKIPASRVQAHLDAAGLSKSPSKNNITQTTPRVPDTRSPRVN